MTGHAIVLFDGVCNLCNATVIFIIRRDPKSRFRFAPLQSEIGNKLIGSDKVNEVMPDSVVLVIGEKRFYKSGAALRIALRLSGLWPLAGIFLVVPWFIRDAVYDLIGRNRYRWFGKKGSCMIPDPSLRERFL